MGDTGTKTPETRGGMRSVFSNAVLGAMLGATSIAIRCLDIPRILSRYSYYDMTECYEYINKNPYAEKPYFLAWAFGRCLPPSWFTACMFFCDCATAWMLNTRWYLLFSSMLASDGISAVNLLISLGVSGGRRCRWLGIPLLLIFLESTCGNYAPGVNTYWYINMQMLPQFREMHRQVFFATHLLILTICATCTGGDCTKLFFAMTFKECGYRGYLLLWCLLQAKSVKASGWAKKVFNLSKGMAVVATLANHIIWWMIVPCGIGNMNFLCWSTLIFLVATAIGTLTIDTTKTPQKPKND
ncbi:hypothetical protein NEDG_00270 [Nematocida displodere]|uniref:Microsporidial 8TM transmembrane domain-containing protein n=1 Tax=Nematocida displodere TaxID=1805483 RepID=A0A177EIL3_9MICR|nr:hypothetical protein NEDG_00270 [Nematocida displodere]